MASIARATSVKTVQKTRPSSQSKVRTIPRRGKRLKRPRRLVRSYLPQLLTTRCTFIRTQARRHVGTPRATSEIAQVAAGGGITAFFALSAVAVTATVASTKAIEKRLDDEIALAKKNGISIDDLYYDFDLPGDAYPFGDAEGMDWVPKDWKPPKKGDPKYLPSRMLGTVQVRNKMADLLKQCESKGIDVNDICVPFEEYEGEFDTNQKRMVEMRRRLGLNA